MTRRERLENRLQRREQWAVSASKRGSLRFKRADDLSQRFYMGQPVILNHHSTAGALRTQERMDSNMRKGIEERDLAAKHEWKAATLANVLDKSIFSDDPDAIEALQAKLAKLEEKQGKFKAINAAIRKHAKAGEEAQLAALEVLGVHAAVGKLMLHPDYGKPGVPSYELSNNNANIRRIKERIQEVTERQARQAKAEAAGILVEGTGDYVSVTFPENPGRRITEALSTADFRWGAGSWHGRRDKLPAEVQEMIADATAQPVQGPEGA